MPARKGQPKVGGRTKGTPNKITTIVKDALVASLAEVEGAPGANGKPEVGAIPYFKWLSKEHPQAYATLIGKVMPTQITAENGGPVIIGWEDEAV